MTDFSEKLTKLRRKFHSDPELGFDETRTKARVAAFLRALGVEGCEAVLAEARALYPNDHPMAAAIDGH